MKKSNIIINNETYEGTIIYDNNGYKLLELGYSPIYHEIDETLIKKYFPEFNSDDRKTIDNLFILTDKDEILEPINVEYYNEDFIEPIDIIGSPEFIVNEKIEKED